MRQTKIHSDCHHHHQVIVFWLALTGALYVMMWWWWLDVHFCHCHQVIVFMINSSVVSGYYYRPFDSDHHLTITSHLKISLQPHTIHDKIVWSHLGTTWWPPSPTVCSAQLRQSLTSVSVSAECYDSYERLVANSTSVSIVCLRLGTISHCAPFGLQLSILTIITILTITVSDWVAGLTSVCVCFLMRAPMWTSRSSTFVSVATKIESIHSTKDVHWIE